jgi:hypothetical protein
MLNTSQLLDPRIYYPWLYLQVKDDALRLCSQINKLGTAIASLRCAMIMAHFGFYDEISDYLLEARLKSNEEDIRLSIIIVECLRELLLARRENRVKHNDGQENVIHLLHDVKKRLENIKNRRIFTIEQEFLVVRYMSNYHHKRRERQDALTLANEALGIAKTMQINELIDAMNSTNVNLLIHSEQFIRAFKENQQIINSSTKTKSISAHLKFDAELRFTFGFFNDALKLLEQPEIPSDYRNMATAFYQLLRWIDVGFELEEFDPKESPLVYGMRGLFEIYKIYPNISGSKERFTIANLVLSKLEPNSDYLNISEEIILLSIQTKAKIIVGDYNGAEFFLLKLKFKGEEFDIFHILKKSLELEVALYIFDSQYLKIKNILADIRNMFDYFEHSKIASISGICEFIAQWSPRAAVFLSFLPDFPTALSDYRKSIFQFKDNSSYVFGQQIPNSIALDLILENFGIITRLHGLKTAATKGEDLKKREILKEKMGQNSIYKQTVSVGNVIFGLLRLYEETKDGSLVSQAKTLYVQYGLFPTSKSDHADHLKSEIVLKYERFLSGFLTLNGFIQDMIRLRN